MRVAIAMPLIGQEEEPSSPVIRDETTEKKKPKTTIRVVARRFTVSAGISVMPRPSAALPRSTQEIGMSRSVLGASRPAFASFRSRNDEAKDSQIVGIARARLIRPP